MEGLIVDNFAGGGGASTGMEEALGRPASIAVNHSPEAIAMHRANHPETRHYQEDVWQVDPREACGSQPVAVAWFSPDCTHFSRAKGGQPRSKEVRCLADVVIRWAREVHPRVIFLENVEEFLTWGPLDDEGQPIKAHEGEDFRAWRAKLVDLGYRVEYRIIVAADHGTPTTRKRLFLVARNDGRPIVWPEASHGKGRARPWRTAAEVIDFSVPCPSIFGRKKPLAEATLRRIAAGVRRYVIESGRPFVVPVKSWGGGGNGPRSINEPFRTVTCSKRGEHALVATFLAKHYGGVVGHEVDRPIGTITSQDHHSLVTAQIELSFLSKLYGTSTGATVEAPLPTVTAGGQHLAEVRAFLIAYYGSEREGQQLGLPLRTIPTRDRFGLVVVEGVEYQITDIGMRMLAPHELFAAQGFPEHYIIDPELNGRRLTKTAQIELAGNSVCPQVAAAIVRANTRERMEAVA